MKIILIVASIILCCSTKKLTCDKVFAKGVVSFVKRDPEYTRLIIRINSSNEFHTISNFLGKNFQIGDSIKYIFNKNTKIYIIKRSKYVEYFK